MLRTIIQTADPKTGVELPIPVGLREQVRHAADILEYQLRRVGERFEIEARWWFERSATNDFPVFLSLTTANRGASSYEFPKAALGDDDSIRSHLWTPIEHVIPALSEEVDRQFERIRHDLATLVTTAEE